MGDDRIRKALAARDAEADEKRNRQQIRSQAEAQYATNADRLRNDVGTDALEGLFEELKGDDFLIDAQPSDFEASAGAKGIQMRLAYPVVKGASARQKPTVAIIFWAEGVNRFGVRCQVSEERRELSIETPVFRDEADRKHFEDELRQRLTQVLIELVAQDISPSRAEG